jgi:hypothetical protein
MDMKRLRITTIILFASILLPISCSTPGALTVKHVTQLEPGHSRQGYFYSLPRSVVVVDVTVLKTEEVPGPFAEFANKYLSLNNVILRPSTQYAIHNISINTYAEPDPDEYYFIEYDEKLNKGTPFSMELTEGGILSAINTPVSDISIKQPAPIKSSYGYFGSEATFNHFMETNLQEKIDTIIERIRMDTVIVERKSYRRTWVEKSSEARAKEVAEHIINSRKKRFDIVSGFAEITYSKEALQYMHDQLLEKENEYLELFTGINTQSVKRYRYYYTPGKNESPEPVTLFHFNERSGIVEDPDLRSEVVRMIITRNLSTRQMGVFTMNPSGNKNADRGIFYRIPEHAEIKITRDNKTISEARKVISQFGVITSLPHDNLKAVFSPSTGAIIFIERID